MVDVSNVESAAVRGIIDSEPPETQYRSHVFVWETATHFLGVHLMSHNLPMPSQALKNIAHLAGLTIKTKPEETAKSLAVIHYVPHHRVMDLTLLETNAVIGTGESCSASLLELRGLAESGGIKPFLAQVLSLVETSPVRPEPGPEPGLGLVEQSSDLGGDHDVRCLLPRDNRQTAVFEMRYNDVSEILTTNFACVVYSGNESFVTNGSFRGTHELLKEFFAMCQKSV